MVPLTTSPTWIFTVRSSCQEDREHKDAPLRALASQQIVSSVRHTAKTHLRAVFVGFLPAVCVDLPQQVLEAAVVEQVTPVAVFIQLAYLAHEEVGNLQRETA